MLCTAKVCGNKVDLHFLQPLPYHPPNDFEFPQRPFGKKPPWFGVHVLVNLCRKKCEVPVLNLLSFGIARYYVAAAARLYFVKYLMVFLTIDGKHELSSSHKEEFIITLPAAEN